MQRLRGSADPVLSGTRGLQTLSNKLIGKKSEFCQRRKNLHFV